MRRKVSHISMDFVVPVFLLALCSCAEENKTLTNGEMDSFVQDFLTQKSKLVTIDWLEKTSSTMFPSPLS